MNTIRIKVNGQEIETLPGKTILEVVREQGLDEIPSLCHSAELEPYGSCFVCVVEVKGRPMLVPSCATRVAPNMEVETCNPRILASRKTAFELLLSNHYADCVSPCMMGCPANVDAQGYIALAAMGQVVQAVDLIRESNPLPAVCGRICVRKCELACRRADIDEPVAINNIKRFLTDAPGIYERDPSREPPRGKSVGIVGAGPAGLTAAWFLARKGYEVVIYEAMPLSGGMIRYGIPTYRLPDEVIDREVEYICRAGVEIRYNTRVGKDISMGELRARHQAIFLAAGAWEGKGMQVEGEFTTQGVVNGIDFLREKYENPTPLSGTIAVVGGGNTAMDVARTSWRLGAEKVIIVYRRTKNEMPADKMEIEDALHEGIEIMELCAPVGIVANEQSQLLALRCIRMKLGEPDASGRRRPIPMEGSDFEVPCQLAVSAIGQGAELKGLIEPGPGEKILTTRWTTLKVDPKTFQTNVAGIFAGGDAADDGPTVVIDAIGDGKKAARSIQAWLEGATIPAEPFAVRKDMWAKPGKAELGEIPQSPRHELHLIPVEERRLSFKEVASGFEEEDVTHEAARCLSCGCVRFDDCELRLQAESCGVDMTRFKGYIRKHKVDDRHPYILYDPNKCVVCCRCIRTCANVLPISALGLVGRGFRSEMRPAMNDPLVETNCISCGNCVDACPTAALTVRNPFPGRASIHTQDIHTHCAFCSVGCELTVKRFGQGRYNVSSSGVAGEYICRYGRFGYEIFVGQDRITEPTLRAGANHRSIGIQDACKRAADGLRRTRDKYGPEAVGVFVSPDASNELMSLAGRIAREGLGTNNIGSLAILALGQESAPLDGVLGFTGSTADRGCISQADIIVCNNTSLMGDHLPLAVEVEKAVRGGARLIVANSMPDTTDRVLAQVLLDPIRGRATHMWNGILRLLVRGSAGVTPVIDESELRAFEGAGELLDSLDSAGINLEDLTGVSCESLQKAASLIGAGQRVVVIHTLDRALDHAAGDVESLANLVNLLRAAGHNAELLLPRLFSNAAGLEVAGADPCFGAGRAPAPNLPGAKTQQELRDLLTAGKLRGALIISEDPLRAERTAPWLANVEFLAVMDWTPTETTAYADVVLPSSTFLETGGTRCNFDGRIAHYVAATAAPAGIAGWEVASGIASSMGLSVPASCEALTSELESQLVAQMGEQSVCLWNSGQERRSAGEMRFQRVEPSSRPVAIPTPITHGERYKREIREVGTARFRVQR